MGETDCKPLTIRQAEHATPVCAVPAKTVDERKRGILGRQDQTIQLEFPTPVEACLHTRQLTEPLDIWYVSKAGRVIETACNVAPATQLPCVSGVGTAIEQVHDAGAHCGTAKGGVVGERQPWVQQRHWQTASCRKAPKADSAPLGQLDLHIRLHPDVDINKAQALTQHAATFWGEHGLWLNIASEQETKLSSLFAGDRKTLQQALTQAGVPTQGDLTPEQTQRSRQVVTDLVLAPLQAQLKQTSTGGGVQVFILPKLADRRGIAGTMFNQLRALTLSPYSKEPILPELEQALKMPKGAVPQVFIGLDDVTRAGTLETTLAHELGHAMGLSHVASPTDLMYPGVHGCLPDVQTDGLLGFTRFKRPQ